MSDPTGLLHVARRKSHEDEAASEKRGGGVAKRGGGRQNTAEEGGKRQNTAKTPKQTPTPTHKHRHRHRQRHRHTHTDGSSKAENSVPEKRATRRHIRLTDATDATEKDLKLVRGEETTADALAIRKTHHKRSHSYTLRPARVSRSTIISAIRARSSVLFEHEHDCRASTSSTRIIAVRPARTAGTAYSSTRERYTQMKTTKHIRARWSGTPK